MIVIRELMAAIRGEGYSGPAVGARVFQDLVLEAIASGSYSENITVKGGVLMRELSHSARRATMDIDMDFMHFPLTNEGISRFVDSLNVLEGVSFKIVGEIVELKQQDYKGKRVFVTVTDGEGSSISSKIDLGVHKDLSISQIPVCFDVCCNEEGATLLANSPEQVFTEKLKSLLRFGPVSTRYKDVFDLYYLSKRIDSNLLAVYLDKLIFTDRSMKERNSHDIVLRVRSTFENPMYQRLIATAGKAKWIDASVEEAMTGILSCLEGL